MKYQLIKPINPNYSALEQVLTNRGIEYKDISHYINTTDDDINSFLLLGEEKLSIATAWLIKAIYENEKVAVIVDPDVDGYCSSATFINYLYEIFPTWVENCLVWFHHTGKQHGLDDIIDLLTADDYSIVVAPDCGTNDIEQHKILYSKGTKVIVLDHHIQEEKSKDTPACIINSQLKPYPNKNLCGCGVVYQFCRFIDNTFEEKINRANNYLDLVALANTADMQSLLSLETKHLINKGFKTENIHNPFIYYMWQKNKFKLGDNVTSWGAAFYIAPLLNAIVRSGTQEEKEIIFESMLNFRAFKKILSTKRGHKLGEEEQLIDQAMRICTNVKNRQTKAVDLGMELLEGRIEENNMMKDKVLLFLIEPGEIEKNIAGLVANKIMAKYQRPCCILTRVEENVTIPIYDTSADYFNSQGDIYGGTWEKGNYINKNFKIVTYQGSARGCDLVGVTNFKSICADSGCVEWTIGHPGAFGASLREKDINKFIEYTNDVLKDLSDEPIYYVDYIYNGINVNPQAILDIADMGCFWGKDMPESLITIKGLKVTKDMVIVYKKQNNTLKITLSNKISLILFNASDDLCDKLQNQNPGYIEMDFVGKCSANNWMNNITPQILIEDFDIIGENKYYF